MSAKCGEAVSEKTVAASTVLVLTPSGFGFSFCILLRTVYNCKMTSNYILQMTFQYSAIISYTESIIAKALIEEKSNEKGESKTRIYLKMVVLVRWSCGMMRESGRGSN